MIRAILLFGLATLALGQGGRAGVVPVQPAAPPNLLLAPSQAGTSAISGVAVDGITGQPLAGVVVYLGPPQHGPPGEPIRQLTDAKGRFVFARLPAYDGYFINASKFGYLEGHYGRGSSGQLGARIVVAEGQWVPDIRVVMNRPGSISGTVLDDRNEPIVGAFVRVLRQIAVSGETQLATGHVGTTDDRGVYRIPDLGPGKYYVQMPSVQNAVPTGTTPAVLAGASAQMVASAQVNARPITFPDSIVDADAMNQLIVGRYPIPPRATDGTQRVYPITFFPAASTLAGAATVALGPGEERSGVDLRVAPVPGRRITGLIDGPPQASAGLTVRLMLPGTEDLGDGGEAATALVGHDGAFAFVNVPAGSYVMLARGSVSEYQISGVIGASRSLPRTPGIVSAGSGSFGVFSTIEGVTMSYRGAQAARAFARQPVSVEGQDLSNVVLTLRKTGSIAGRYVFEGPRPSGPSDLLAAQPARGTASLGVLRSRDNVNGPDTFVIDGLMPGEYVLESLGSRMKSLECGGQDRTYRPIDMSTGSDVADCVVTFTDKSIIITGSARDDRGQGIPEIGIIVFPVERDQWTAFGFSPRRIKSVQATNAGSFRFQSLPAGDYYFIAVPAAQVNAWLDPGFLEVAAAQATRVHLDWGGVATQDLTVKTIRWPR